jgi:alanine racemase
MAEARSWVDVDLGAVAHNVGVLRGVVAPAGVVCVVKADGYGHGAVPVAGAALEAGATALAVAIAAEGVELREAGIGGRVLVLAEPPPSELPACAAHDLEPAVYTLDGVATAAKAAADLGKVLPVHVKVDTGMHRVGAAPDDALAVAEAVAAERSLELGSIWTHCAVADEPDDPYTAEQLDRYDAVLAAAARRGLTPSWRHAANSAGGLCHPAARYDVVRAGIATYGIAPARSLRGAGFPGVDELRPALSWRAVVSYVKVVAAGERISYGLRHRFDADTIVATVPLGYADGVPRRWSEVGGEVLVGGRRRPVVGVVTMDQLMVDCGPAGGTAPEVGDEVMLIGGQGKAVLSADDWAERLGTIAYEIVCGIGPRVPRRYHQ